jgi:diguanylate cyclase (GGDEF)-like protein
VLGWVADRAIPVFFVSLVPSSLETKFDFTSSPRLRRRWKLQATHIISIRPIAGLARIFTPQRSALLCLMLLPIGTTAQPSPVLTAANQIRRMSADQAARGSAVHLRGVVTVPSGWKTSFFFQDRSSGISVDRPAGEPVVRQGDAVEIDGVTSEGKFAPLVIATTVKLIGKDRLPTPRKARPEDFLKSDLDSQWIAVDGVVRSSLVKEMWGARALILDIDAGGGMMITARVHDFSPRDVTRFQGSTVSVRGVCGTIFNDRRQSIGTRLFVSDASNVTVLHPGPADPFDRPLQSLSNVRQFEPDGRDVDAVRVQGTVTYFQKDQGLYIENQGRGILVHGEQFPPLAPGSNVEVVGYPGVTAYSPSLEDATIRVVPSSRTVIPVTTEASRMIVVKDGFSESPFDAQLVRLQGVLVQSVESTDGRVLFFRDGNSMFTARLPAELSATRIPPHGSFVRVTGICLTRTDNSHEARSFRLLLRSTSDIEVLKAAPWWDEGHAKTMVVALCGIVLFLLVALIVARREAHLRQISLKDPLTDLYNRRGFLLLANHQWQLAVRRRTTMLLFYVDLDKFKQINDTFGHKQGDIALQHVSQLLRNCFRSSDLIGRLGGDEFAVVAMDAESRSQHQLKARILHLVDQHNREAGRKFNLSVSVGILECNDALRGLSFDELLTRADQEMYLQKRKPPLASLLRRSRVAPENLS